MTTMNFDNAGLSPDGWAAQECAEELDDALKENERLRDALMFYAKGYSPGSEQHASDLTEGPGRHAWHGKRAREVTS